MSDEHLPAPNVDAGDPVDSIPVEANQATDAETPSVSPTISSSSSSFVPIQHVQDAIQIINEHKEFNENIMEYIHTATTPGQIVGNNYHIISVFGSQSTGKSTLLNRLFNTNFDVMDETRRQQTTKGIWMAYSPDVSTTQGSGATENVFVMDVEGTDGRERGEDQDFERKAALFALSTSEILIVNIWETQVGLYQGANMGLLKTVFEVNLSLFGKAKITSNNNHKVLLLIVIRDHIGVTPLQNLAETLVTDLNKMWADLNKPAELSHLQFKDFFDVDFHALRHKVLQPKEFEADIKSLGDRLVVKKDLFKPNYHHNIPVDGWTMYAENCWDQIDNNKDLDLPTQQILVAKFKCDEISAAVYSEFASKYSGIFGAAPDSETDFEQLGLTMADLTNDTLENYDVSASRYNESIYLQKRDALKEKIHSQLRETFDVHSQWIVDDAVAKFGSEVKALRGKKGSVSFYEAVQQLQTKYLASVLATVDLISLSQALPPPDFKVQVSRRFEEVVAANQKAELAAIVGRAASKVEAGLVRTIQKELGAPDAETWDRIMARFKELIAEVSVRYGGANYAENADFGLGTESSENAIAIQRIGTKSWVALDAIVHRLINRDSVLVLMKERFEDKFRYDENGIPRMYQKSDELETSFAKAREHAEAIVPILSQISTSTGKVVPEPTRSELRAEGYHAKGAEQVDADSDNESDAEDNETAVPFYQVLTDADIQYVGQRFKREVDAQYVETKRSMMSHVTHIPYYIYLLIVVLGWNEFMAVVRNPFVFAVVLIFGAGVYVLHQLSMLRPAMVVLSKMADEAVVQVKKKLRELLLEVDGEVHGHNIDKITGVASKNETRDETDK